MKHLQHEGFAATHMSKTDQIFKTYATMYIATATYINTCNITLKQLKYLEHNFETAEIFGTYT
jgi:hypothetical protein